MADKEVGYQGIRAGQLAFHSMDAFAASIGVSDSDGKCSPELIVCDPINTQKVDPEYYAELLRVMARSGFVLAICAAVRERAPRMRFSHLSETVLPVPPFSQQRACVDAIRSETARIDTLIARKGRLLALLEERRQAFTSHAVTKGLDPNAPSQETGLDGFPPIPAGWRVWRLKHLCTAITSGPRGWAEHYAPEGATFIRIGNLDRRSIQLDLRDVQHVAPPDNEEARRARAQPGDLLVSITAYIGTIGVVPHGLGAAYISQHVACAHPRGHMVGGQWLGTFLSADVGQRQFSDFVRGGTKDGIGLDDVGSLRIFVPPLIEQDRILSDIQTTNSRIHALVSRLRISVQLLRERRQSFITAAVTGQSASRDDAPGEVLA